MTITSATILNAADKGANMALSGGGLTVSASSSPSADQLVRATDSITTAQQAYFEFTCTTFSGGDTAVGICNAAGTGPGVGNNATNAAAVYASGNIWANSSSLGTSIGTPAGGVVCVAVDGPNDAIYFRLGASGQWKGASGTANPLTNSGGASLGALSWPMFPCVVFAFGSSPVVTANFGATAFTGVSPWGPGGTISAQQTLIEATASNPNPPMAVGQTLIEATASNPNPPMAVAQLFVEAIFPTAASGGAHPPLFIVII